ncbi:hypothetical protein [Streptomyces sp. BK205]|uniref:hypothetical protein n=1 Tax=Streptomyces sp. BK205 TaxID=2512164 RepID=UPI0014049700|nr:hypothetical protein [Streptomyces sp. BK205]
MTPYTLSYGTAELHGELNTLLLSFLAITPLSLVALCGSVALGDRWSRRRRVIAAGVRPDRRCPAVLSDVRGGGGRADRAGTRYGQHRELRPVRAGLCGPG